MIAQSATLKTLHDMNNSQLTPLFAALLALPAGSSFAQDSDLMALSLALRHETGCPLKDAMEAIRQTLSTLALQRMVNQHALSVNLFTLQDKTDPDTLVDVLIAPKAHGIEINTRLNGDQFADTVILERYDGQIQLRIMPSPQAEPRKIIALHLQSQTENKRA